MSEVTQSNKKIFITVLVHTCRCIHICTPSKRKHLREVKYIKITSRYPGDQLSWFGKTHSLINKHTYMHTNMNESGIVDKATSLFFKCIIPFICIRVCIHTFILNTFEEFLTNNFKFQGRNFRSTQIAAHFLCGHSYSSFSV